MSIGGVWSTAGGTVTVVLYRRAMKQTRLRFCSRILSHGGNYIGSTDLMLSNGSEITAGFDFSSNIFLITSFMLLLFLKLYIQHTYTSVSLNML